MPLTEFQQEYLNNCSHRWNVKTGATGSGKSFVDYSTTIPKRILSLKGEGLCVMLGNTRGTLERNILEPMREIWSPELVGDIKADNTVMIFGHKVYALGADNKKHIARIQGATFEYVYGDEITTWDQGVFEMLKSRLRCDHSCFDGTCNPAGREHWFKKFLDSDADIYQQAYTIDDGCLSDKVKTELKKEYAGTVLYNRYILGQWTNAEGLIFDMFDNERHIGEAETEGEWYVSSDYGILNPNVWLLWHRIKGSNRWMIADEEVYSGRETKKQKTVAQLADDLDRMLARNDITRPKTIIIDPSAAAMIVELRKRGYKVMDADNDVANGIADVGTMLYTDRILVSPKCKNTIEEFGIYSWDPKAADQGEDKPIKEHDHCMDAARYFIRTMKFVKRGDKGTSPHTSYLL